MGIPSTARWYGVFTCDDCGRKQALDCETNEPPEGGDKWVVYDFRAYCPKCCSSDREPISTRNWPAGIEQRMLWLFYHIEIKLGVLRGKYPAVGNSNALLVGESSLCLDNSIGRTAYYWDCTEEQVEEAELLYKCWITAPRGWPIKPPDRSSLGAFDW